MLVVMLLILSCVMIALLFYYTYVNISIITATDVQAAQFVDTLPIDEPAGGPVIINDTKLKVETVVTGLNLPTSMSFLGRNDILVLEKNNGAVKRIVNGSVMPYTLLEVNVATQGERGLLGVAITKNQNAMDAISTEAGHRSDVTYVFLYYTENVTTYNGMKNVGVLQSHEGTEQVFRNRLYRYEMDYQANHLTNPKLLLDLPADPPPLNSSILSSSPGDHNGGKVDIGPDNNVYVTIGDVGGHRGLTQNEKNASTPVDGTSGILRVSQGGKPVINGPLGETFPLNLYYAYGIRNSFGIDFDPLTGHLWDTENGPAYADEINLVEPGFNSGWDQVQGKWKPILDTGMPGNETTNPTDELVYFSESGKNGDKGFYSSPEFTWFQRPFGPTALKFFNSDKLGEKVLK